MHPYKEIIAREDNYGVGRQLISARRELLDERGYDRMIMMEDDIEVGKTYFSAILSLSDWAQDYEDVGTVQVWNVQSGSKEDLSNRMGELVLTNRHFVTYCLSKKVWDKIKPVIYEYEQKYLLKKDYLKRPHYRIRYFMSRQIKKVSRDNLEISSIPQNKQFLIHFLKLIGEDLLQAKMLSPP